MPKDAEPPPADPQPLRRNYTAVAVMALALIIAGIAIALFFTTESERRGDAPRPRLPADAPVARD